MQFQWMVMSERKWKNKNKKNFKVNPNKNKIIKHLWKMSHITKRISEALRWEAITKMGKLFRNQAKLPRSLSQIYETKLKIKMLWESDLSKNHLGKSSITAKWMAENLIRLCNIGQIGMLGRDEKHNLFPTN